MGQAKWRREHGDDRRTTSAQDRERETNERIARALEQKRQREADAAAVAANFAGEPVELTIAQGRQIDRIRRDAELENERRSPRAHDEFMDQLAARGQSPTGRSLNRDTVHHIAHLMPGGRAGAGVLGMALALAAFAPVNMGAPTRREVHTDPPLQPDKGQFDGSCNRTSCQQPIAGNNWWNRSTRAYYCQRCALGINEYNPPGNLRWMTAAQWAAGPTLCIRVTEPCGPND